MSSQYSHGSEWRRWDLHLHTPFTKKEDMYDGNNADEKWDYFFSTIKNYVGDGKDPLKAICAIAITDYLSIENYKFVLEQNRLPDCIKLILPNVELRMQPIAQDSPINIHCIFSPEIANEIEERFFAKLAFEYNGNRSSATKKQLISLGRAYEGNCNLPDEEAYRLAYAQYVISFDTLSNVFKNDPELREKTIIVVSNKSTDGASGMRTHSNYFTGDISQLDATRRSIYQLSDMIFSSSPSDISYFLGERVDNEETVKRKCGSLMPCIHGCDAHKNEKIFEPDNKRFCWIKADPTFEGLKQVLYEPKERVRISPFYPDSKSDYYVIDYVVIDDNKDFEQSPIYFSDKLTCIIGGKSTGKSLLIHNMALAIDEEQVRSKSIIAATNVRQISNLKVYWRDGACSDKKDIPRKIVYIPQTYLNRLSDEKEQTTEIDSIIQDIVLQDENVHQLYLEMNKKIAEHKQTIAKTIVDLLQTISIRNAKLETKKEIGNKIGIELEIKKLSSQLEQMSKEYNVTEDEIKQYQDAIEKMQQSSLEFAVLNKEKENIKSIKSVLNKKDFSQSGISRLYEELSKAIGQTQSIADANWINERNKIIVITDDLLSKTQKDMDTYKIKIDTLKPKMEGNKQISNISKSIANEKQRLNNLLRIDDELGEVLKLYDTQMNIITNVFETYRNFYITYTSGVNNTFTSPTADLEFEVECVFRIESFRQKLLEILNNKSIGRFQEIKLNEITEKDVFDSEKMWLFIESIINNSSETLQLKAGYTLESALRDIFSDWNNINYVVAMDSDSIEYMSPGKKALVLLRLLISMAESKCPILIDQPEDDLDNRSIFDELIQFIKSKKVDRQIITVTHNANIVLGGDAELVIVANQEGRNAPNNAHRFEYRAGAIENNTPIMDDSGVVKNGILNSKGIQTHVCEILEGGERAFDLRRNKYRFIKY